MGRLPHPRAVRDAVPSALVLSFMAHAVFGRIHRGLEPCAELFPLVRSQGLVGLGDGQGRDHGIQKAHVQRE